eukprot:7219023-Prymnesium_polylepis.1
MGGTPSVVEGNSESEKDVDISAGGGTDWSLAEPRVVRTGGALGDKHSSLRTPNTSTSRLRCASMTPRRLLDARAST